jgi:hypothetical protein
VAIGATLLTSSGSNGATPYTTASISPAANALIEVDVVTLTFGGSTPPTVTLSGNGLTYVEVATIVFATGEATRLTRFRAMGASPSSGAITITPSGASSIGCIWSVKEFTGVDTSGTDGSGAYVQTTSNQTTGGDPSTLTLTLSALSDATNNAVSAAFGADNAELISPDTGYSELSDTTVTDLAMETQWKLPGSTTVTATHSMFISQGGIASELKAASAGFDASLMQAMRGSQQPLTVFPKSRVASSGMKPSNLINK